MTKVMPLLAASTRVDAQDLCPAGPFETDVQAIAASMAAEPLQPLAWYADRAIANQFRVTDGAWQSAGGGLGGHGEIHMWYDAQHYVSVYLETEWPGGFELATNPRPSPPLQPNQLVRKIAPNTYTLTVGRPTAEEAREFACLANQLVTPQPKPTPAVATTAVSGNEVIVTGHLPASRCEVWLTDAAYNNYTISTSRPGFAYASDLSCDVRRSLESESQQPIYGPITETFERQTGTWRPSRVGSLAIDAADNLYMLMEPGSARQHHVEVRKRTPSGDVTVLQANARERFEAGGIVIDAAGHILVIANVSTNPVLFDLTSNEHFEVAGRFLGGLYSEVMGTQQTLYATSIAAVYRLSPTGSATQLADLSGGISDWVPGRFHLARAPDGRLLLSDAKRNIIEAMTPEGQLTPFAGASDPARFNSPRGLAVGRDGSVYVADAGNHAVRRIDPHGHVATVARLRSPDSIAIDSTGVLYVTDRSDNLIRKVLPTGAVRTFAP